MLKILRQIMRKLLYGHASDSDAFIQFMRKKGCHVGERVTIFDPPFTVIDITRPWLISIGDDVKITRGVTILTHGYDWSVLQGAYGEILGSSGEVSIGNNVFIGMNSTILKGSHIGNNVIIGANSLVNKDIPDNVVAAGVPAKILMTLDQYHEKRKKAQIYEAAELVELYIERYGKDPDDRALDEFFWLFENDPINLPDCWRKKMRLHGNESICNENLLRNKKQFDNKEFFIKWKKNY